MCMLSPWLANRTLRGHWEGLIQRLISDLHPVGQHSHLLCWPPHSETDLWSACCWPTLTPALLTNQPDRQADRLCSKPPRVMNHILLWLLYSQCLSCPVCACVHSAHVSDVTSVEKNKSLLTPSCASPWTARASLGSELDGLGGGEPEGVGRLCLPRHLGLKLHGPGADSLEIRAAVLFLFWKGKKCRAWHLRLFF